MIYQYLKNKIPTDFSGEMEISESWSRVRLGIIKASEGSLLAEDKEKFTIIPYGAWNPAGMIDLKNYKEMVILIQEIEKERTRIKYQAIRKWSNASAKLYAGWIYLLILFFLMLLVGWIGEFDFLFDASWVLFAIFGILFVLCFGIDYFLLFSSDAVHSSIRGKIVQQIGKFAYLLRGADLKIAEDTFIRREREYFSKESRQKGWMIFVISLLQNLLFLVLFYYFQKTSNYVGRMNSDMETMWILFIVVFFILFLLHLFSMANLIFLKMGNLDRIMKLEKIPGSKDLYIAGWLAILPVLSFLSTFFAGKFLFSKKEKADRFLR